MNGRVTRSLVITLAMTCCLLACCGRSAGGLVQPPPATNDEAIAAVNDILQFRAYRTARVKVDERGLAWDEQLHVPAMAWSTHAFTWSDIRKVGAPGRGVSGWTVTLQAGAETFSFEVERAEDAGRLHAAIRRLSGQP